MKRTIFPLILVLFLLFSCSGEGYVKVANLTPSQIMVSVNDEADVVLNSGDTTATYSVATVKGSARTVPVEATGDWIGDYSQTATVTDGETVVHTINSTLSNITIKNGSVDSAMCMIENNDALYFGGNDSLLASFMVDGSVETEYGGRYMFLTEETMSWFPGTQYRFELVPNACEIQLNNLHPTYRIDRVYLSKSTDPSWGEDDLGDDLINPMEGYIWKAEGDVMWDVKVLAADPHPDSLLYVYEYYDVDGCASDITHIYEFPTIFTQAVGKFAKSEIGNIQMTKKNQLNKSFDSKPGLARVEKVKKIKVNKTSNTNTLMKR